MLIGSSTIKIVAILVIVLVFAGGFYYISNLQANLAIAEMNNQKLEEGIKAQQELMVQMQNDIKQIQNINSELQDLAEKQKEEIKAVSDKFNVNAKGEARDFGALAAAKPKVIERAVNRGTRNALRCLELASGAKHTEQELNARTTSEINRECPAIANPNFIPTTP
jgi:SMC interacting uncharacterized protein involved in chromosome segregation